MNKKGQELTSGRGKNNQGGNEAGNENGAGSGAGGGSGGGGDSGGKGSGGGGGGGVGGAGGGLGSGTGDLANAIKSLKDNHNSGGFPSSFESGSQKGERGANGDSRKDENPSSIVNSFKRSAEKDSGTSTSNKNKNALNNLTNSNAAVDPTQGANSDLSASDANKSINSAILQGKATTPQEIPNQ